MSLSLSRDELLEAGYRHHNQRDRFNLSDGLYQKRIKRDGVTLFFLNVYWYNHRKHEPNLGEGWMPEVQFRESPTFDVKLHLHDMNLGQVEAFFLRLYDAMGCKPYGDDE